MKPVKSRKKRKPAFLTALRELRPVNFIMLTVAGIVNSVGVTLFLAPVNLYDSGFSGTSMLLNEITPEFLTLSFFLLVLNIPFFIFGLKKQGIVFTIYSVYAVAVYSAASFVFTNVISIDLSTASPIVGTDLLLCAAFGGLISGIGSGTTIRFGGAIDGVEVMAVVFAKRLSLTVGGFVMAYNVVLYAIIGLVFGSWQLPLYSTIAYYTAIKSVDFIVEGLDKAKSAMIVTKKEHEISEALSEAFGRGITHIDSKGYYSGDEQTIIYFVVNRFQISKMKDIVTRIDKDAFITISEVSDVLGKSVDV